MSSVSSETAIERFVPVAAATADRPEPVKPRAAEAMLDGPVLPTLLRLAAPTIALMSLQGIVSAGETAFIGRLGPSALAGVSLSFPLVMLMTTLSAGAYGGGVASRVARALGSGKVEEARGLTGTALGLAALIGVAYTLAMQLGGGAIYRALGASGPSLAAAVRYSDLMFLSATPFWIFGAAASVLRGTGNAAYPALVGAVGGVVTLAVSPLLIFGAGPFPGLGIAGAAAAIVAYNVAAMLALLRPLWRPGSVVRPAWSMLIPRWRHTVEILRIAIPSGCGTILTNATVLVLTGFVAPFGEAATAGYGAAGRLEYLLIPVVFGIGSALVPLVAANDGAGRADRVRQFTRAGALLGMAVCAVVGLTVAIAPQLWMGLFTTDASVQAIGESYLRRVGPAFPCLGLGLALYFASQGRGRMVPPLLATSTRLLISSLGGALVIRAATGSLDSLFHVMSAGLAAYALIMVFVMRRELGLVASE